MKTIDARGKLCPTPLIMTKKAINDMENDETLLILIDNDTSVKNVRRFLEDNGLQVKVEQIAAVYHLTVNKTGAIPEHISAESYCSVEKTSANGYVMVFKQNKMGHGADELGSILMKAFVNTLPEISNKPKTLIFLNTAIHLTLKDSPVLEALKKVEKDGIEILVCGTCLDFFGKKEALAVGIVSNMYDIMECMSKSDKVIHP